MMREEKAAVVEERAGDFDPEAIRGRLRAVLAAEYPSPLARESLADIPALLAEVERWRTESSRWKHLAGQRGDGSRNG